MSMVELLCSRSGRQAVAVVLIGLGAAGCSSETTRFNENPYSARPQETTGSIRPAPVAPVQTSQLPPPQASRPASVAAAPGGQVVAGGGMPSFTPPPASQPVRAPSPPPAYMPPQPEVTGSVVARKPAPASQWSWDGGTAITVAQGETVDVISRRYG